jgi:hypothetical protein
MCTGRLGKPTILDPLLQDALHGVTSRVDFKTGWLLETSHPKLFSVFNTPNRLAHITGIVEPQSDVFRDAIVETICSTR